MAPNKSMKRPAAFAASAGPALKKPVDLAAIKCSAVAKEIGRVEELPGSCKRMITGMLKECLTVPATERHRYQVQAMMMADEILVGAKTKLEQAVIRADAEKAKVEAEKASRSEAVSATASQLQSCEEKEKHTKEAVSADTDAMTAAKANLATAEADFVAKEAELLSAQQRKTKFESIMSDMYEPLKTSKASGDEGSKALRNLGKGLREFDFEESLVKSLAETLKTDCSLRGTFDGITLQEVDTQMTETLKGCDDSIKVKEANKLEACAAKNSAEETCKTCNGKLLESQNMLAAAVSAKDEAKKALTSAGAAVTNFYDDLKAAALMFDGAKKDLDSFVEGPWKSFEELKILAAPVQAEESEAAEEDDTQVMEEDGPVAN